MMSAWIACIIFSSLCLISSPADGEEIHAHHVVLKSPENVKPYLTSSDTIVVAWDPPQIYVVHDVLNATFDVEELDRDIEATKTGISLVAMESKVTHNSTAVPNDGNSGVTDSSAASSSSDASTPSPKPVECHPWSYFENDTVEMKKNLDVSDFSMVITLKESDIRLEKQTVTLNPKDYKLVQFSEGCIVHFVVQWEATEKTIQSSGSMQVASTVRTARITGLKAHTKYKIIVKAVYTSSDEMESTPIFMMTKSEEGDVDCNCNQFGAITKDTCNITLVDNPCECKEGYKGLFCEDCSPGYYRTAPEYPCHRCPCDVHSSSRITCRFMEGFLQCDRCHKGYKGNICHTCDMGFYRYNQHCVPCQCNGNTPADAEYMCMPTTGLCVNCQHNTTGFHCERCLRGYHGDAITYKNCTLMDSQTAKGGSSRSSISPGVIAAMAVLVTLVVVCGIGYCVFRRWQSQSRRRAFWTVEMNRDKDGVGFNSVHNDDIHMDDDDMNFYADQSNKSSSAKYSRLNEEL